MFLVGTLSQKKKKLGSFCAQVPVLRPGLKKKFIYNIWQDAGNRTRVAARCGVLPMSYTHPYKIY